VDVALLIVHPDNTGDLWVDNQLTSMFHNIDEIRLDSRTGSSHSLPAFGVRHPANRWSFSRTRSRLPGWLHQRRCTKILADRRRHRSSDIPVSLTRLSIERGLLSPNAYGLAPGTFKQDC
jgi:hypothetical protein